jgi:hypothetical protein
MVSSQKRQPRTLGEDSFDLSSTSLLGIPKERTPLWGFGETNTFVFKVPEASKTPNVPEGAKLIVSEHAGTYLECKHGKVQIFVCKETPDEEQTAEEFAEQFRGEQIIARGELWRKKWDNGREGLYLDLKGPVVRQDGMTSSHEFKVHGPQTKKDREPVFTVSIPDCDGIVAVYTYVPFTRV